MNRVQRLYKVGSRSFCSSTPLIKTNERFKSLFPNPTPINPMKDPIFSIEPINNGISSSKGTTFKTSLTFSPENESISKEDSFLFEKDGKIKIEDKEEDDFEFEVDNRPSEFSPLLEETEEHSLPNSMIPHTSYIRFLQHYSNSPYFLNFLIQSTSDSQKVRETIEKALGFDVSLYVCHQIPDNSLYGRTVSTAISLVPKDNISIDTTSIHKTLSTFGVTIDGIRLKVLDATKLRTISIFDIDHNVSEEDFRYDLSDICDTRMMDPKHCKITFSSKSYKAHKIGREAHGDIAHLTFESHLEAMKAIKLLSKSGMGSWIGLSRYAHSEGTAAAELITVLERRKFKQMQDLQLMKEMVNLKSKVKELEEEIKNHERKRSYKK
ncbi:hypothetical protein ACTA71_009453 [Dictyostelium dimigraforme]